MMRSLVLAVSLLPLVAVANPSSDFDDGAQGWSVVDLDPDFSGVGTPYAAVLQEGYIEFADPSPRSFFFEAPSYFLGDLSAYLGGSLRYSQKVSPITPEWRDDPDVVIVGGGLTLVFQNSNSPGADWTEYSVGLASPGWRVGSLGGAEATSLQFQAALGSVDRLRIRGEYVNGVVETTSLDNVSISPVPEPGNWVLTLSGLLLLAGVARSRVSG